MTGTPSKDRAEEHGWRSQIDAALAVVDSDQFKALMAVDRVGKCTELVAGALSNAHEKGLAEGMKRAAEIARDHSFGRDIDWWLNATKKDVSAEACNSVADAILAEIGGR